jgi:hypothetical protein
MNLSSSSTDAYAWMAMFSPILWPQNTKQQREIDHQRCHLPHQCGSVAVMQEIRFKALFFLLALLLPHLYAKF